MVNFDEDNQGISTIDADNIENNSTSNAYLTTLTNLTDKQWIADNRAAQIDFMTKRMALLQGLPLTIFSYAAGIFRSNNKYNLFGLIDLLTYVSRLNILGSINIRPDITFTFLNEQKILDGYIATYNNGILGSALNIFMHPNDFLTMDEITDKSNDELNKIAEIDNTLYENIKNNLRAKISINSLSSPKYFLLNDNKDGIHLNEIMLKKYKSIIYGGTDYEQFEIILNNISSFPNDSGKGVDIFTAPKFIFHYYIDLNYEELEKIAYIYQNPIDSSWDQITANSSINIIKQTSYDSTYYNDTSLNLDNANDEFYEFKKSNYILIDRIKRFNQDSGLYNNLSYNDLFTYFFKNIFNCEYNYGQIYFFQNHKKIKYIYLPATIINNTNWFPEWPRPSNKFDRRLIQIYNYEYDDLKRNSSEPEFSIILMPTKITDSDLKEGTIGTFVYQSALEKMFRYQDGLGFNPNSTYFPRTKYGTKSPIKKFYTILAGYDDNLSYKYLDELKNYQKDDNRLTDSAATIIDNIYLCYYDGNRETFKKIVTQKNSNVTLNNFNGIKKITNYNTDNLFLETDYDRVNILDDITEFVYNINEGKASSRDIVKNNILSYNNGLILGIDSVILIYLCQVYYNDFQRIFTSNEIFYVYIQTITNNIINNPNISYNIQDKFKSINKILNNNYSINNNDTIIDNLSNIVYENLSDLSFNSKDDFFMKTSEIFKRDIFTTNQKSEYKILEFKITNPNDLNNILDTLLEDFDRVETNWYDITYKYENVIFNSIINNSNNIFYNKIMSSHLTEFNWRELYRPTGYNLLVYKDNISIYEAYIMLQTFSKHFLKNYIDTTYTNLGNNLDNIVFDLYNNYKVIKTFQVNQTIIDFANQFANNNTNNYQLLFNIELKFYRFVLIKELEKPDGNKNNALKQLVLFYKSMLNNVLSSKDYYKYINDTIDSSLNAFNGDSIFMENIILDESPYWNIGSLNIPGQNANNKCLNFTLTDIFIKDLSYNTLIPLDYHRILEPKYFNKKNSESIYKILKFMFHNPNTGLIHDFYKFFDFINSELSNNNDSEYIFYGIDDTSYYMAYILLIDSIYKNTNPLNNLDNINYKNYYIKNDNKIRYNLLKQFQNIY